MGAATLGVVSCRAWPPSVVRVLLARAGTCLHLYVSSSSNALASEGRHASNFLGNSWVKSGCHGDALPTARIVRSRVFRRALTARRHGSGCRVSVQAWDQLLIAHIHRHAEGPPPGLADSCPDVASRVTRFTVVLSKG